MSRLNATAQATGEAVLAASSGSEAKPQTIAEWFRYLTETGQLHHYWNDGSEKSKAIEAGFGAWKAKQDERAKPSNTVYTPGDSYNSHEAKSAKD